MLRIPGLLLLILILFGAQADAKEFEKVLGKAKAYAAQKKFKDAIEELKDVKSDQLSDRQKHLRAFALGEWYQQVKQPEKSLQLLEPLATSKVIPAAYVHYLLGHAYKELNQNEKALKAFDRALSEKPNRSLVYQSRFEFSEVAIALGKESKAHAHLMYLERRWRNTFQHPDVVWRLIGVELAMNRKWKACRWARKMYSSYAGHDLVKDWGADLPSNTYNKKALGCVATTSDLERRIKRLQLYGQANRARQELNLLLERSPKSTRHEVDIMLAQFLEDQGYPDEALQTLIKHYPKLKSDYSFQILLAKIAAKASEYTTAIGAYYKAYKMAPGSRLGRRALFSSAFLSYQSQDYDGANRKFQELISKHRNSGLARDAKWHLAWIRYLRRDFAGAQVAFDKLMKESYGSRRRRYRPFNDDRTRYWLAMSYLQQGKASEAKEMFTKLVANKSFSYYSILSNQRLQSLATTSDLDRTLASNNLVLPEDLVAAEEARQLGGEENESEETLDQEEEKEEIAEAELPVETPEEAAEEARDETVEVSTFSNPKLQKRFDAANLLIELGFDDWARFELYEIERRTRNKNYLRQLMKAYDRIGSYNRSLYISEIFFATERSQGLEKNRDLWMWNFPRGYSNFVEKYSRQYGVSEALVLSIMRAESHFFQHAISPVGARGLMQLMPYTAEQVARLVGDTHFADLDLSEPDVNIRYGTRYLARLSKQFQGLTPLVAAAYNAGPHRVNSWLNSFGSLDMDEFVEHIPFVETRNYVKKVLRHHVVYNSLYKPEVKRDLAWVLDPIPFRVSDRPSPRENWGSLD